MPFREPHRGRDELAAYARWSFTAEQTIGVRISEPIVGHDGLAVAEFRVLAEEDGQPSSPAGCVFVRFDAAGPAVAARD
ncbi:hypothetical protein [Streptomyces sp. NPDC050564]|uniref:hypothetical protein n=1 Tax=Streptomyces sp. NPDC050564 TaxID=3365631 RepID=UPI0037A03F75